MTHEEVEAMKAAEASKEVTAFAPGQVQRSPAPLHFNVPRPIRPEDLDNWFTHHPPTNSQIAAYKMLRDGGKDFAQMIVALCPPGADTTAAIRKVREAVMTANAAIACEGASNG